MKRMSPMKPSSFGGSVRYAPHPGSVGKGGGSAPLRRACAFGNLVQGTVRVPAEYGTRRCADEIFAGRFIV